MQYVHRQVGAALQNACRSMSEYAYAIEYGGGEVLPEGSLGVLSEAWAETLVSKELNKDKLVKRLLDGHVECGGSSFLEDGNTIEIVGNYSISMGLGIFKTGTMRFSQRAVMNGWMGYSRESKEDEKSEEGYVYVTASGTVFHKNRDCSYLNPSVKQVAQESLITLRSADGSVYKPCEECGSEEGSCFITDYGDRYHHDRSCSGLKRTIYRVPLFLVEGVLGACSKCGS